MCKYEDSRGSKTRTLTRTRCAAAPTSSSTTYWAGELASNAHVPQRTHSVDSEPKVTHDVPRALALAASTSSTKTWLASSTRCPSARTRRSRPRTSARTRTPTKTARCAILGSYTEEAVEPWIHCYMQAQPGSAGGVPVASSVLGEASVAYASLPSP